MRYVLAANLDALQQGVHLLQRLKAEAYGVRNPLVSNTSIGLHIRHISDHYVCLERGLADGRVDYTRRAPDPEVENQRDAGLAALQRAVGFVTRLSAARSRLLLVRMDTSPADDRIWSLSSVTRELEFVLSHTVHHHALVSVLCRLLSVPVDDGFGVAHSTLVRQSAKQM